MRARTHNISLQILPPLCLIAFLLVQPGSQARQFRTLIPIATPAQSAVSLPQGSRPVQQVRQVDRGTVEQAMRKVVEKWNTPQMAQILGNEFYDSSRLLDNMDTLVPRNATVRLQSVQGIQTLQQYIVPGEGGSRGEMVSIVSATARTQVEFEQPGVGFVRLPGTNEYILKITTMEPLQ